MLNFLDFIERGNQVFEVISSNICFMPSPEEFNFLNNSILNINEDGLSYQQRLYFNPPNGDLKGLSLKESFIL